MLHRHTPAICTAHTHTHLLYALHTYLSYTAQTRTSHTHCTDTYTPPICAIHMHTHSTLCTHKPPHTCCTHRPHTNTDVKAQIPKHMHQDTRGHIKANRRAHRSSHKNTTNRQEHTGHTQADAKLGRPNTAARTAWTHEHTQQVHRDSERCLLSSPPWPWPSLPSCLPSP